MAPRTGGCKEEILKEIRFEFLKPYKVAGMGEPWAMKIDVTLSYLRDEGIGAILTLTEDDIYGPRYEGAGFMHHHEPIDDCEPPKTFEAMDRVIDFIDNALSRGMGVAVHCLEGRGRTGLVLAAWIAVKESLDAQTAIEKVYRKRFHTVITPSQREYLKNYLNGKKKA